MLTVLVLADQFAHVFTTGAVPTLIDLFVHEALQRIGKGDVHGAHARQPLLAKFGKSHFSALLNAVSRSECPLRRNESCAISLSTNCLGQQKANKQKHKYHLGSEEQTSELK